MPSRTLSEQVAMPPLKVLRIDSSSRVKNSVTRALADLLVESLVSQDPAARVATRDVASGLPFVNEDWVNANFTDPAQRSEQQRDVLSYSDMLVDELKRADVLVIGAPLYNFGIPAALKAWIDMIARAGLTFRYSENGPVGLLSGKKAYLIMASGGTAIGSSIDFATAYLRHALSFVGIEDIEVIEADRLNLQGSHGLEEARKRIMRISLQPRALAA